MVASLEILDTHKGTRVDGQRTICEVHRQLADVLVCRLSDRPGILNEALPLLNEAYLLGIRLVQALIERKLALPDWAANHVAQADVLRRQRKELTEVLHAAGRRL